MRKLWVIVVLSIFFNSCGEEKKYIQVELPDCNIMIDEKYELIYGDRSLLIKPTEFVKSGGHYIIQFIDKDLEEVAKKVINRYDASKHLVYMEHLKIIKIGEDSINTDVAFVIGKRFMM